jgi:hypothetical protein
MAGPGESNSGKAFVKGGAGCLLAFLAFALFAVLTGGEAYLDAGGVVMLIVIGGVIGLIVNAIYQRGRADASEHPDPPEQRGPIDPE